MSWQPYKAKPHERKNRCKSIKFSQGRICRICGKTSPIGNICQSCKAFIDMKKRGNNDRTFKK